MDAAVQFTTPDQPREETPRLRVARFLQEAEEIGFWWQSRRHVAQRLGVPDSSFRYHLGKCQQRIDDSRSRVITIRWTWRPDGRWTRRRSVSG
jgi:hypothetical protein